MMLERCTDSSYLLCTSTSNSSEPLTGFLAVCSLEMKSRFNLIASIASEDSMPRIAFPRIHVTVMVVMIV